MGLQHGNEKRYQCPAIAARRSDGNLVVVNRRLSRDGRRIDQIEEPRGAHEAGIAEEKRDSVGISIAAVSHENSIGMCLSWPDGVPSQDIEPDMRHTTLFNGKAVGQSCGVAIGIRQDDIPQSTRLAPEIKNRSHEQTVLSDVDDLGFNIRLSCALCITGF